MAVMQALLGFTSDDRWLRNTCRCVRCSRTCSAGPVTTSMGRLGSAMNWLIGMLGQRSGIWSDDVWIVDSIPVEWVRSRGTVRGSNLAGWAEYPYCGSQSPYFCGLRVHLVCTLQGLPVGLSTALEKWTVAVLEKPIPGCVPVRRIRQESRHPVPVGIDQGGLRSGCSGSARRYRFVPSG